MRKIFLLIVLLLANFAFSQEFILTEANYKLKEDNTKNYVVIDFQGHKKEYLFKIVKENVNKLYKELLNEQYVELENEQIVLNIMSQTSRTIFINREGPNVWRVVNRYEINFKDGKIMIRPSFVNLRNTDNNNVATIGNFFNSRGIVRFQNAVMFAEAFTNTFIKNFKKDLVENKNNDW
ncbi:hypothetical protein VUJ46_04875 [Chryseobacterium sp. MYb264]|uniref:hypothetical protein n=1 Tax=Chryseobacterium sp. MYb264 TaxID=2745153 RepID=UPI002E103207|nr:hypothetical protein VUJ46_04875 [Chryseobacterium sp. MYb264]